MIGKFKTKIISISLIIFILADMFSPYSILLKKSYAAAEEPLFFIRRNSEIQTSGKGTRYFEVLIGLTGNSHIENVDVELAYNNDKLAPTDKAYTPLATDANPAYTALNVKKYMVPCEDEFYQTNYDTQDTGALSRIDPYINEDRKDPEKTPPLGRIIINNQYVEYVTPVEFANDYAADYYDGEIPEGYNGFLPLYKINFAILDDNIATESDISSDLITLYGNDRSDTGFDIVTSEEGELKDLSYVKYDGFVAAEESKNIQSVTIKTTPTKVNYEHGETVELAGGVIEVTYTNGESEEVDMSTSSDFVLTSDTEVKIGDTKVTGKYKDYVLEYPITVTDPVKSIELTSQPTKTTYQQGETIELAGAIMVPTTKSGVVLAPISLPNINVAVNETIADVKSPNFEKTGTTPEGLVKGRQRITLTYEGVEKQIDLLVNDTVGSISVQNAKTKYEWGDELDKNQGEVVVTTTSGSKLTPVPFTNGSVTITGYEKGKTGTQTLTVEYLGKTTTYDVTVTDPVVAIEVDPLPKTTYNPEEELDLTGSNVYEKRKSGAQISGTPLLASMISGYENTKPGTQTLTVSYKGRTTTFDVTILDTVKSLKITGMKTEYSYKDSLDLTGAKVTPVLYSGDEGTPVTLTKEMIVSTFDSTKVGAQEVTIEYEGVQQKITVNVADVVKSISVKTEPQTRYKYGEALNIANGVITVTWQSGAAATEESITADMIKEANGDSFNSNVTFPAGQTTVTKPLTINYGGEQTTYNVTIVNEIMGIAIKTAPKTTYNVNDTLDVTGGEITITRQVGTEDKAIVAGWVTGLDTTKEARNQPLTVTYTENEVTKTTSYNIDVVDQVIGIEINTLPTQKEYGWGEELNLAGGKVDVTYGSETKTIDMTRDMITNYNKETTGPQNLIVEFEGKQASTTYPVTVVDKLVSIEMKEPLPQTEYKLNEAINKNGYIVITRQSGATEDKALGASGVTITGFDSSAEIKNQRLTVTYTENYRESSATATTHYDINVLDKITSIAVTTKPKDVYNYDELLSTTNGKVTITKASGATEEIDLDDCTVTGYNQQTLGKQTLTVSYTRDNITKTCTYEVTVNDYVKDIEIVTETNFQTKYAFGERLNLVGGKIKKLMASGAESTVELSDSAVTIVDMIDGKYVTEELGTRVVKVQYAGKEVKFSIEVEDEIESIVLTGNLKLTYDFGEDFDPNGAFLKVVTKATSPNGYEKQITADMLEGFWSDELGTRDLTITYLGEEFKKPYTINDYVKDIELTAPTKKRYSYSTNVDAKIDVAGGSVRKIMASGDEVLPIGLKSEGVTYNEYVPNKLGTQVITVNYAGYSKTFEVVVRDELTAIELVKNPKQDYIYGDNLVINGAEVKVHYLSKEVTIPLTADMVGSDFYTTGSNALTNGVSRNATVSFSFADGDDPIITKTAIFTYTVSDQVTDLNLVAPTKDTYFYGLDDKIDLAGGTVQKVMKSGIEQEIISLEEIRDDVKGFISRPETLGEQTISVTYGATPTNTALTKTFTITVKDRLEGISITGLPEQKYFVNDEIKLTNAKLNIDRLKNDETVDLTKDMIDDFSTAQPTDAGESKTATITKVEDGVSKETSFQYTVADYVKEITALKEPSKKVYYLHDDESEFDISDGELVISMASGKPVSNVPLTDSGKVKVSGFDTTKTGTKVIAIEYTNEKGEKLTTSYTIEVKDKLLSIELVEGTPKQAYKFGEPLNLGGAKLKVNKLSGSNTIAINEDTMVEGFYSNVLTKPGEPREVVVFQEFDGVRKEVKFTYTVTDYISSVELNKPSKLEYYLGEELDLTGGSLSITMASSTPAEDVDLTDEAVTVTGYNKDKLGTQTITVEYEGFTKTFEVLVKDRLEKVEIVGTPKSDYKWNEKLDLNGAKLQVTKLSGVTTVAITDNMISGFTSTVLTEEGKPREVTISYEFDGVTKTDSFEYTVADFIKGVTLKAPSKLEYNFGTELKLDDAYLVIAMASGNSVENVSLTDSRVTITGYHKNELGAQTVKVEYAGFEAEFGVVVVDKIKGVEFNIDSIAEKDYKYGANLDLSKATAVVENLSGEKIPVQIDNSMISGYDPTKLGKQTVTVTVEGFTSTIEVNVVDYVVGIELTAPTKSLYIVKEELDLTGGSVKVTMASGAVETKTLTKDMVSGYVPTKLGNQTVKVTYEGFTKQFVVKVEDKLAEISMEAMPKTQYKYGEELDLTGAKLRVTNESDSFEIINITKDMVTGYNPTKLGEQIITVTYKDKETEEKKTTTFPVMVEDYVKEIKFTKPTKTQYKWGEELDLTGAKFTEILASGKVNKEVNVTSEMVTKFNNKVVGKQTLTATYGDTKGEFQVSVVDNILSMSVTKLPNKLEYIKGENLELAGGQITIIKDSGLYNFDITSDMVAGYDPNALGTQIVTIRYQGFEAKLTVIVKEVEQPEEDNKPSKPVKPSRPSRPSKPSKPSIEEDDLSVTEDVTGGILDNNTSEEETNSNASENKDKENNNDLNKDVTLGVKEESGDSFEANMSTVVKTVTVSGLGIVALIALIFGIKRRSNVKIYEEDEEELILVGKDRLDEDNKEIDISKYVQNAPEKNIVVVLNKNISKKLDKETLKIKLDNEELETVVNYEDGEFEIRIEK